MGLFTQDQETRLRERLTAERAAVVRRLGERRQLLAISATARPDDSDWATDSIDQGLMTRLLDRDAKLLREIDRAVAKMAAGTYGVCEATGEPIEFERLLARPWSRLAVGAKEAVEREAAAISNDNGDEPLTTTVVAEDDVA